MDGGNLQARLAIVIEDGEQAKVPHQLGREILGNEALVLEIAHGEVEGFEPGTSGDLGKPFAIFFRWALANPLDVMPHGESESVRIDAVVPRLVVAGLVDHVGMGLEKLQHEGVAQEAFVEKAIQKGVVPKGGPAFVHHLGLALREKILRNLAYDPHHFPLPWLQQRSVLLDEVQEILFRLQRETAFILLTRPRSLDGQRAPQFIDLTLQVFFAIALPKLFLGQGKFGRALVSIHADIHQCVARIEEQLRFFLAIALLAFGDVVPREDEVIDDGVRIGPGAEHVITLEEAVVPIGRMGDNKGLHRQGIFLHQISNAGVRVDGAYLMEKSLSVDNLFLFMVVFAQLQVPPAEQHRVLFWGILGALLARAGLIAGGTALLSRWHDVVFVLGAFLIYKGYRTARSDSLHEQDDRTLKWLRAHLPVTSRLHGHHFVAREDGKLLATPLLLALLTIELSDIMFAVDSVPAVFAITEEPFIVYTSNVFAILGLRALYLVLAELLRDLRYLQYGLAAILALAGAKLILSRWVHLPAYVSLV